MRRLLYITLIPVMLLALEKVNLIKDAGFELESSLWRYRTIPEGTDSILVNKHDADSFYLGEWSGTIDTRKKPISNPSGPYVAQGRLIQGVSLRKKLSDLDSLECFYMYLAKGTGNQPTSSFFLCLEFFNASDPHGVDAIYSWYNPWLATPPDNKYEKYFIDTINEEGVWYLMRKSVKEDLIGVKNLDTLLEFDTISLRANTNYDNGSWYSQKAFFDALRLTGWADYDIGLTRISGDLAHPRAVVWNNGREDQTDVKVIATIEGATPYADTVIVASLASDDSTEVSFKDYTGGSGGGTYTLTVVTGGLAGMSPDECDEDDILTREYSGIGETPSPSVLRLDFASLSSIRYSLPPGEQGTISLYDPAGRRVESIRVQGEGSVSLKAGLAIGVYFIRLETGHSSIVRKAVVLD